jgi:TetR/AcrR family transcriptional repressor for divergent bdcA
VIDTQKIDRRRGRPRSFDIEAGLATAQRLFHDRGYDQVSLGQLTEALGINPPSFYAAFGSKAGLFERVMARYAASALPLGDILRPGRSVAEALSDLLATAARIYTETPGAAGCLVLEAARSAASDDCGAKARAYRCQTWGVVHDFIAAEGIEEADRLADFVDVTLSGLSASAREGWNAARLQGVAETASLAIAAMTRGASQA